MSAVDQLQALTEKFTTLEAQLQSQSGAGTGASSCAVPGQITVKVYQYQKLHKFVGNHDENMIEDWILDTECAITGQTDADAIDFLLYHLDGAAKE